MGSSPFCALLLGLLGYLVDKYVKQAALLDSLMQHCCFYVLFVTFLELQQKSMDSRKD